MTFAQILGHERQKDLLRRALKSDRLANAYLFTGPDGIGKRLVALALARAVFCPAQGCGDCPACRKIDHGNHPDLHVLEADGANFKIEQIRLLQKELAYRALEASRKICLIEAADKLNRSSGNALLKTLEEPPGNAIFILLTAYPQRVLQTIRSRCQPLPFNRLAAVQLEDELRVQLDLNDEESHILAALSEGSFKKALGKDRDLYLNERRELIQSLVMLSSGSILPIFALAERLAADKDRLPEVLEIYQAFYRDALLRRHNGAAQFINIDLRANIETVAGKHSTLELLNKLVAIKETRHRLERNVNRQLAMETLLLQLVA
ncbi:MAG: DNA polymerase III subunit delta' [Desulfuromonadaceae bacterium]|nr:DNA polymerase III subunit delta' [Desulfuromonadaceae bacterium]